jgi:hypothetical protein
MATTAQHGTAGGAPPAAPAGAPGVVGGRATGGALGLFTAAMIVIIVGQVINIVPFLREVPLVRIVGGIALLILFGM